MYIDSTHKVDAGFTASEAIINLLVLAACITLALFILDQYLRWQLRKA
jgi:hypothetical protein